MISLGAHYGAQLVGGHHMLKAVNPLPCTLVGVEAEPGNFAWISDHMRDNGIDPDAHWLLPMALSDSHDPVLFPVGSSGYGSNNCIATNAFEVPENSRRPHHSRRRSERGVAQSPRREYHRICAAGSPGRGLDDRG